MARSNPLCPNGHETMATDVYCRICGERVVGGDGVEERTDSQSTGTKVLTPGPGVGRLPRAKQLILAASAALVLLGVGLGIVLVISPGEQATTNSASGTSSATTSEVSTVPTTVETSTTRSTVAPPAACPDDSKALKAAIQSSGLATAEGLSHDGVKPGSVQYTMGTRYIYFRLEPIDQYGGQPVGVFLRCDSGTWKFITVVDGLSCGSWTGEDMTAAITFGICPKSIADWGL
jgi:hypothetical protein